MSNRAVFLGVVLAAFFCVLWTGAASAQSASDAGNDWITRLRQAADNGDARAV